MRKLKLAITLVLAMSFLLVSCGPKRKTVESISASQATVDANWSPEDIRKVRSYMVKSIEDSRFIRSRKYRKEKPRWILAKEMRNDSDEHINTRVIMEKIRTKVINNGVGRFIDDEAIESALKQLQLQQSDLYNQDKAAKLGKLVGAKLMLRGSISNIRKRSARTDINYYMLTLQIVNLETTEIIWTDEYEIGRKATKSRYR